jgi:MoxR-like ATPase
MTDLSDVRRRLLGNESALVGFFSAQRAPEIRALNACALSRHHALLLGPAGLAKSLLVQTWAGQFSDAVYRRDLLTRQSTEADVLAYLDVPKFAQQGLYSYRHDGKLTEAHFAFPDETFKANGGLLNALLTWLNERTARGGYASPLITCVGASNEMGEDESVAALEDRFLVRFWLEPLDKTSRLAFLRGRRDGMAPPALGAVPLGELAQAHAAASALPVEDTVLDSLSGLVDSLSGSGIYVSDRRIGWALEYLRAYAWLDGAPAVFPDHIDALRHVLWRRPEERPNVDVAISSINRGVAGEIRQIVEGVLNPYHEARQSMLDAEFSAVALDHATAMHRAAKDIKERYSGKVPPYVKERAAAYVKELHEAFAECKALVPRSIT